MNTFAYAVALTLAAAIWRWPLNSASQQNSQPREAGQILEIKCNAHLKKPNDPNQPRLDPKRNKGLKLYAHDEVKCIGKGYLKVEIYGRTFDVDQSHGWYPIPEKSTGDDNAPGPGRVGSLKGTYKIDLVRTSNADSQALSKVPNEWLLPLKTPAKMAIELKGKTITIESSVFPKFSFEADGREHQLVTREGRTIKSLAFMDGEQLTVKSSTDTNHTFEAVFSPEASGKLKVIRRLYAGDREPDTVTEAVYHRVSDVAQFKVYSQASSPWVAVDRGTPFKEGDVIEAELNDPISSRSAKNGDRFTLTVRKPAEYDGAIVKGHVSRVRRDSGRVQIILRFDSILLANGKSYRFAGTIEQLGGSGALLAGGGPGAGAIIGGTSGGARGAAIGAVIGGASSSGAMLGRGGRDLELKKGTEITIRTHGRQ